MEIGISKTLDQRLTCVKICFLVPEKCAKLSVAIPRIVIGLIVFEDFLPDDTDLLQSSSWSENLGQFPRAAAIRIKCNGFPEGDDGPIGVTGGAQGSTKQGERRTIIRAPGHCRTKIADGLKRVILLQEVSELKVDPEIFRMKSLGGT
jgi:hypothetical protein